MKTLGLLFLIVCTYGDEITSLPGLTDKINFKHYSGYFAVSKTHFLHYWFVESQNNPAGNPVLLWMNGGPGCSSMDGLLNELGPYLVNDDGVTLSLNQFAWNKNANILFLEAPAGVGYSYSSDGNVTTDDDQTSLQNYEAIKQFFSLFPQFRANDFYIGGESYGGIYIPTLASRVLSGNSTFGINFKGIFIGNGMMDFGMNTDTLLHFLFGHGVISRKTWEWLDTTCCQGCTDSCPFHNFKDQSCEQTVGYIHTLSIGMIFSPFLVASIANRVFEGPLNPYDMFRDCYRPSPLTDSRAFAYLMGLGPQQTVRSARQSKLILEGLERSNPDIAAQFMELMTQKPVGLSPPCINDTAMVNYMNLDAVRTALHIPQDVQKWDLCSDQVALRYRMQYKNVYKQIKQVLDAKLRVLLYYGDTDLACNFLMGEQFAESLKQKLTNDKHPWHYQAQIAGYATNYENLDFLTVKGAGHMVPQWRRGPAMHLITSFLNKQPY